MKKYIVFNLTFFAIFALFGININASQNSYDSEQVIDITEQVIDKVKVTKINSAKESKVKTKSYDMNISKLQIDMN
jgi:hypothetical protein